MKILYFNNCWFTNVGEAFIDIGAMELIKRIFKNDQIINVSGMNRWYIDWALGGGGKVRYFDFSKVLSADLIIFAGMFASKEFVRDSFEVNMLRTFAARGTKVIFLGLGQCEYTDEETQEFAELLREIQPCLLVSRDDVTYSNFRDVVPSLQGIDCAFWVKDVYDPRGAEIEKYDVISYNRSPEPSDIYTGGKAVVRAYHFQYGMQPCNVRDNMLVSDTPYDYLTLYANADRVHTDLVHATIASLQYGRHVKFKRPDKRGYAIDALTGLETDQEGFLYLPDEALQEQKKHIEKSILNFMMEGENK